MPRSFDIHHKLPVARLRLLIPRRYQTQLLPPTATTGLAALIVFRHDGVIVSSHVRRALSQIAEAGEEIKIAAGYCFTVEGLAMLSERGFQVLESYSSYWTDESHQRILQLRMSAGANRPSPMASYIGVAKLFGDLIARADYAAAHALLTKEARVTHSPNDFNAAVESMISYGSGPINEVEVMEDFVLKDWPDKLDGDVAIVYVALSGDGFCEAVTVTLVQHGNSFRIRELEWGRP